MSFVVCIDGIKAELCFTAFLSCSAGSVHFVKYCQRAWSRYWILASLGPGRWIQEFQGNARTSLPGWVTAITDSELEKRWIFKGLLGVKLHSSWWWCLLHTESEPKLTQGWVYSGSIFKFINWYLIQQQFPHEFTKSHCMCWWFLVHLSTRWTLEFCSCGTVCLSSRVPPRCGFIRESELWWCLRPARCH